MNHEFSYFVSKPVFQETYRLFTFIQQIQCFSQPISTQLQQHFQKEIILNQKLFLFKKSHFEMLFLCMFAYGMTVILYFF